MMAGRRRLLALGAMTLLLSAACATGAGGPPSGGAPADSLFRGVQALDSGDFQAARSPLRWLAARCETGARGRRAVLLLATLALDPRNPEPSPDEAARLAARYLALPDADPSERAVAGTLYLLAIDRGGGIPAPAGTEGEAEASSDTTAAALDDVARRFRDCGTPVADSAGSPLPELPGTPTAAVLSRVRAERDSLWSRVEALEAELRRIRGLLQEGGPPDTLTPGPARRP